MQALELFSIGSTIQIAKEFFERRIACAEYSHSQQKGAPPMGVLPRRAALNLALDRFRRPLAGAPPLAALSRIKSEKDKANSGPFVVLTKKRISLP